MIYELSAFCFLLPHSISGIKLTWKTLNIALGHNTVRKCYLIYWSMNQSLWSTNENAIKSFSYVLGREIALPDEYLWKAIIKYVKLCKERDSYSMYDVCKGFHYCLYNLDINCAFRIARTVKCHRDAHTQLEAVEKLYWLHDHLSSYFHKYGDTT